MRIGILFVFLLLGGCQFVGTIFTGVHRAGTFLLDDRPLSQDARDVRINWEVREALAKYDKKLFWDVEITVFEGEVLLTGALPHLDLIQEATERSWQVPHVQKVYNYIRVGEPAALTQVNQDAALSAKIRTELMLTRGIASSNYKLVMENGAVYLMGIIRSAAEFEQAAAVIKNTPGVEKVVSLMRVAPRQEQAGVAADWAGEADGADEAADAPAEQEAPAAKAPEEENADDKPARLFMRWVSPDEI